MSYSYEGSEPDSSQVINENEVLNNKRRIRLIWWQGIVDDEITRRNRVLERDSVYKYYNSAKVCRCDPDKSNHLIVSYDEDLKSIVKSCSVCNYRFVLEKDTVDASGNNARMSAPPERRDLAPLFTYDLTKNVTNRNPRTGAREASHLPGSDIGSPNDLANAIGRTDFHRTDNNAGPTFNERLNWGRKRL
jgi:hypothetical protein